MAIDKPLKRAEVNSKVLVTKQELPISCPMPNMSLWNMHPKVYLDIEEEGKATCPYCGTIYEIEED